MGFQEDTSFEENQARDMMQNMLHLEREMETLTPQTVLSFRRRFLACLQQASEAGLFAQKDIAIMGQSLYMRMYPEVFLRMVHDYVHRRIDALQIYAPIEFLQDLRMLSEQRKDSTKDFTPMILAYVQETMDRCIFAMHQPLQAREAIDALVGLRDVIPFMNVDAQEKILPDWWERLRELLPHRFLALWHLYQTEKNLAAYATSPSYKNVHSLHAVHPDNWEGELPFDTFWEDLTAMLEYAYLHDIAMPHATFAREMYLDMTKDRTVLLRKMLRDFREGDVWQDVAFAETLSCAVLQTLDAAASVHTVHKFQSQFKSIIRKAFILEGDVQLRAQNHVMYALAQAESHGERFHALEDLEENLDTIYGLMDVHQDLDDGYVRETTIDLLGRLEQTKELGLLWRRNLVRGMVFTARMYAEQGIPDINTADAQGVLQDMQYTYSAREMPVPAVLDDAIEIIEEVGTVRFVDLSAKQLAFLNAALSLPLAMPLED